MFILSSHGIRAKHTHKFVVITPFFVHTLVQEQAMLFDPSGVYDNLGLLIGGSELGRYLCPTSLGFYAFLYLLRNSATSGIALKAAQVDFISEKNVNKSCVNDVR